MTRDRATADVAEASLSRIQDYIRNSACGERACPRCEAPKGHLCRDEQGRLTFCMHAERVFPKGLPEGPPPAA